MAGGCGPQISNGGSSPSSSQPGHDPTESWDSAQDLTEAPEREAACALGEGQQIARRYRLLAPLGQGSFGSVWEAVDTLGGDTVAVKLMAIADPGALRNIRQEVTALRWLRLPGVVQMFDDGEENGRYFVVMERIAGRPFPGAAGSDWERLRLVAVAVAETLAAVHLAGVVHRDLKPGNLLVDGHGRPTLLDFGLAVGRALAPGPGQGRFAGTPRYAAPEQCRGELAGPAADLYALGVMLFEALTGTWPHSGGNFREILARRAVEPAPALSGLVPGLPAELCALVDALLAVSPEDRPSATALAVALGGAAPAPLVVPEALRARARLFVGPDRFLRRDTDAARLLRWRAGPSSAAMSAELEAWRRAGLVRPGPQGRLTIEPPALASLEAGLRLPRQRDTQEDTLNPEDRALLAYLRLMWPDATRPSLARLLARDESAIHEGISRLAERGLCWPLPGGRVGASASGEAAPGFTLPMRQEAHRKIAEILPLQHPARLRHLAAARAPVLDPLRRAFRERRALSAHLSLLGLGLQLARAGEDRAATAELLGHVVLTALERESLPAVEHALYELGRDVLEPDPTLDALLRAAAAGLRGEAERAIEILDTLRPLAVEDLERWRVALQVRATALLGTAAEERLVASLEAWSGAGSPTRQAQWLGWYANLRYRQADYAAAADLHAESVALRPPGLGRLAARRSLAAALMEIPQLEEAKIEALRAAREARHLRHTRYESLSLWIARNARFRGDEPLRPDPAQVASAAPLGPHDQGLWAMTEAAIAWRSGRYALSAELARVATACLERCGQSALGVLTRAIVAASVPGTPQGELAILAEQAAALPGADFAVQALGLIRQATAAPDPRWRAMAMARAEARPASEWELRLEVLSYREALA